MPEELNTPQSTETPTATPPTPPQDEPLGDGGISALKAERERAAQAEKQLKALQQQMKAFEGIDPDTARKAQEIAKLQEEWAQKESQLKADIEAQYQPQIQQYQSQLTEAQQQLVNYQRDSLLEKSFYDNKGIKGDFEAVAPALRDRVQLSPDGVKILDEKGQPMFVKGEPATINDLLQSVIQTKPWVARHFEGNNNPGLNINGKGDYSSNNPAIANLPAWERVNLMRSQGKN